MESEADEVLQTTKCSLEEAIEPETLNHSITLHELYSRCQATGSLADT